MSLKNIARKLMAKQDSSESGETTGKKMTPNEVELAFFKERERLDNVKKELEHYRKKDAGERWVGSNILKAPNVLNAPNKFKNGKTRQKKNQSCW